MSYSPEIVAEVCDRMANGKGLRQICEADDMPDRVTFLRWVDQQIKRAVPINDERRPAEIFGVIKEANASSL